MIWDEVAAEQVQDVGEFTLSGAVDVSNVLASATIHVVAAIISNDVAHRLYNTAIPSNSNNHPR